MDTLVLVCASFAACMLGLVFWDLLELQVHRTVGFRHPCVASHCNNPCGLSAEASLLKLA